MEGESGRKKGREVRGKDEGMERKEEGMEGRKVKGMMKGWKGRRREGSTSSEDQKRNRK